ncbi:MAG: class I SAM-dependent methyltransferase [wastewater metagenome]|nr:class I SAM-dependent methyltransferase [Candidatus Loosdrechtia aerotolerans]
MRIEEIRKLANTIEGWLTDKEGELLFNLAKNCTSENGVVEKSVIVEIGSWKGKSTIWLGIGSKLGGKLKIYSIDPHKGHKHRPETIETFEEFKRNIRKADIDDIITPIVKTSEEAAKGFDKPIKLIFIDGNHEYDYVKLDVDLWFPKVMDGGIIAFHDTASGNRWKGPKKVVKELIFTSKKLRNVKFVNSITIVEKVKRASVKDRLMNRYTLFLKDVYEFTNKLSLPQPMKTIGKRLIKQYTQ